MFSKPSENHLIAHPVAVREFYQQYFAKWCTLTSILWKCWIEGLEIEGQMLSFPFDIDESLGTNNSIQTIFYDSSINTSPMIVTLLKNRESMKKKCLGLWLVWSESSYFLVSEMLCFKILLIWLFEKNNFDHFF